MIKLTRSKYIYIYVAATQLTTEGFESVTVGIVEYTLLLTLNQNTQVKMSAKFYFQSTTFKRRNTTKIIIIEYK